jgi:hypothetical protein
MLEFSVRIGRYRNNNHAADGFVLSIRINMFVARIILLCLVALLSITSARCHELTENRATLVLRDEIHVTLTCYVDYPDVLYAVLAPKKSHREFLLAYSAMKPEDFRQQMLLAQSKLQTETRATLNDGKEAVITGWVWPDSARIQVLIQQEVMKSMVGGVANTNVHAHAPPTEIRANITSDTPIKNATIKFAEAFGKMLLVSYRPEQSWVAPKQTSSLVKF